jgi:enoyl-CoA hydratase/carnithine racemase
MADMPFTQSIDLATGVAMIELCRPADGNRLTAPEVQELGRAIRAAGARREVKVVVARAQGDAFCLGRVPGSGAPPKTALDIRSEVADPILSFYADVRATEVPVIALPQGPAYGFGTALVGVADLAIADDTARFAFTEMAHNLPPTLAMSACLEKIPYKTMMHMVLTCEEIDGNAALRLGLVSQVAPRAGLEAALAATLAKLTGRDRSALCAVKEYQNAAWNLDAHAAARLGAGIIASVLSSQAPH